jgi:hypothetical protein
MDRLHSGNVRSDLVPMVRGSTSCPPGRTRMMVGQALVRKSRVRTRSRCRRGEITRIKNNGANGECGADPFCKQEPHGLERNGVAKRRRRRKEKPREDKQSEVASGIARRWKG